MLADLLSLVLFIPALLSLALVITIWPRHRTTPGVKLLIWFMVGIILTSLAYSQELHSPTLEAKLWWVRLRYLGNSGIVAPAMLLLACWYTGRTKWLAPRRMVWLYVLPVLSLVGFYTNDWHHLHYVSVWLDTSGPVPMLGKENGPLYWFMIAHSLGYMFLAVGLVAQMLTHTTAFYCRQATVVFIGLLAPVLATLVYLAGWRPWGNVNFTPFAFAVTGLAFAWSLSRQKLLDTSPVAFRLLFEKISIGVLVVNRQGQLVEINPTAQNDLGLGGANVIGQPLAQVCTRWPELTARLAGGAAGDNTLRHWDGQREFSVEVYPLQEGSTTTGQMVLLRDATQRLQSEKHRLEQQRLLTVLGEREKLARELHDGLGQVIGYVSIQAQAAEEYLENGQTDLARATLARLHEIALDAYADVRSLILEMKSKGEAAPGLGFGRALEHYLESFAQQHDLPVLVSLPPNLDDSQLGPDVELHLLRIIQEALNNAHKHAAATQARVTVLSGADDLQVIVADNGQGFDLTSMPAADRETLGHFGLQIMQERAAEAGGTCEIRSFAGRGTQVIVRVPRHPSSPSHSAGLSLLIVDDHPLFRDGLRNLLTARGMKVVGEAENGRQAVDLALQLHPDVILMDYNLPELNGIQATRCIKAELPTTHIVMLTVAEDDETLFEAFRAGASGYLLKNLKASDFFSLLEALARGETPISPSLATRVMEAFSQQTEDVPVSVSHPEANLSIRQQEILEMAAQGMLYKEIGARLSLSESAVKYHIGQIIDKLHVDSRTEAVAKAEKLGWLTPTDPD